MFDLFLPFAEYGIAIFSVAALTWIVSQVFKVIASNTQALTRLSELIAQQQAELKILHEQVQELRDVVLHRQWAEESRCNPEISTFYMSE